MRFVRPSAGLIGEVKPAGGVSALKEAYQARFPTPHMVPGRPLSRRWRSTEPGGGRGDPGRAGGQGLGGSAARRGAAHEARSVGRSSTGHPAGARRADCEVRRSRARGAAELASRVHRDRQRHDRVRAGGSRRAADLAQLRDAGAQRILQRPPGASRRAQLRDAGRRSAGRRRGRPRLHHSRRAQRTSVPARHGRHGVVEARRPVAASSSSRTHRSRTSMAGTRRSGTS